MTKLLKNIFRSVNIALMNELAMLCDRMNIDVWEVIDAAATKPFGFMKFQPGPGLGGRCIYHRPVLPQLESPGIRFLRQSSVGLGGKVNREHAVLLRSRSSTAPSISARQEPERRQGGWSWGLPTRPISRRPAGEPRVEGHPPAARLTAPRLPIMIPSAPRLPRARPQLRATSRGIAGGRVTTMPSPSSRRALRRSTTAPWSGPPT